MIVIRTGRHPHEVFLLLGCLAWGTFGVLAFHSVATAALRSAPYPWGHVYYALLAASSLLALGGAFWEGIKGPLVERSGLLILTGLLVAYIVFVLSASGARATGVAIFLGCLALANIWRAVQIGRQVKQIAMAAAIVGATDQLGSS